MMRGVLPTVLLLLLLATLASAQPSSGANAPLWISMTTGPRTLLSRAHLLLAFPDTTAAQPGEKRPFIDLDDDGTTARSFQRPNPGHAEWLEDEEEKYLAT